MNHLIYAKICIILTVGLAGLNIHQLLSSYEYIREKISELHELIRDEAEVRGLNWISLTFYFVIPAIYLFILLKADFFTTGIIVLSSKFLLSAFLGIWTQKQIFTEVGYTKKIHLIGKVDNFINVLASIAVAYFLLFPI
jgi:hypothetical protein